MIRIPLTQGKFAIVDILDFPKIAQYKWYAVKTSSKTFYAATKSRTIDGNREIVYMHRLLLSLENGEYCDHVNLDGLDNRKENLRKCSKAQNKMNEGLRKDNQTGFKGVSVVRRGHRTRYRAHIRFEGLLRHLGYFDTLEEAHRAYCKAGEELFGEFLRTS